MTTANVASRQNRGKSKAKGIMRRDWIFDLGMNNGDDTAFYLNQGYNVLAVEADPTLVAAGCSRFAKELESGKLRILNVGLAEQDGSGEFWICETKPQFNSFLKESASRDSLDHHSITVKTLRPATLFREYGVPHYLKIDIEGYEELCLSDLAGFEVPPYLSVECHHFGGQGEQGLLLIEKLNRLGYRRFKLINQFTFCAMSGPRYRFAADSIGRRFLTEPPFDRVAGADWLAKRLVIREILQCRFRWDFPVGSSGVWGEDTTGKWITFDEARRLYARYQRIYKKDSVAFWCDWHAAL
jgi:FkbM family methyltransferase